MTSKNFSPGRLLLIRIVALAALSATANVSQAQDFGASTLTYVVGGNYNAGNLLSSGFFDFTDGAPAATGGTLTFDGLDSHGNAQTMTYSGAASASTEFGKLHASASGTVTNPYYSPINPFYVDSVGVNEAGSPDAVQSGGVARTFDTLTFGGISDPGYKVRYVFHIDGASGGSADTLAYAELVFGVDNNIPEGFKTSASAADFGTNSYDVAWSVPTIIRTTFAATVFQDLKKNQPMYREGDMIWGSANYGDTLTLSGIEVLDPYGDPATGWTVTSASGTQYPMLTSTAVPEPGFYPLSALLALSGWSLLQKHRARRKR